jgi:membrane-associated phospholipid phosphatase
LSKFVYGLKRKLGCVSILFCLLFAPPLQEALLAGTSQRIDRFNKQYLLNFGHDFTEVYTSPKNWGGKDILKLCAVTGAGLLFFAFDQDIKNWVQKQRTTSSDDFFNVMSSFGNGFYLGGALIGLYAAGEIADENSLRRTALLSLESWLTSSVFVIGVKVIAGRARPRTGESSHSFHPFSQRTVYNSFPSGHSCTAWAVATTIADQTDNPLVDGLAYSIATLVALSRVQGNDHWASDSFIGSAVGYFIAKKVCALSRNRKNEKLSFSFELSRQRQAVGLSIRF